MGWWAVERVGGGWVGEINYIDHLSPVETETRTELGKNTIKNYLILVEAEDWSELGLQLKYRYVHFYFIWPQLINSSELNWTLAVSWGSLVALISVPVYLAGHLAIRTSGHLSVRRDTWKLKISHFKTLVLLLGILYGLSIISTI